MQLGLFQLCRPSAVNERQDQLFNGNSQKTHLQSCFTTKVNLLHFVYSPVNFQDILHILHFHGTQSSLTCSQNRPVELCPETVYCNPKSDILFAYEQFRYYRSVPASFLFAWNFTTNVCMYVSFVMSNCGIIGEWLVGKVLEISCHGEFEDRLCAGRDSNL